MNLAPLIQASIDYEKGLARFLGDRELYESILLAFLEDSTMEIAEDAMLRKDHAVLLSCAHDLKGVSGNMDMRALYLASCQLYSLLQKDGYTAEALSAAYARWKQAYTDTKDGIRQAMEANNGTN